MIPALRLAAHGSKAHALIRPAAVAGESAVSARCQVVPAFSTAKIPPLPQKLPHILMTDTRACVWVRSKPGTPRKRTCLTVL